MARFIEINGALTAQPGSYQQVIKRTGGAKVAFVANSVVCVIGECTGGAKPGTIYELFSDTLIDSLFKSGPLYDMVRIMFSRGVSKVIAVRVGDQTQGTGGFEDGSSNDLIDLTSVDYGLEASKVSYKTEAATDGAYGRKITISKTGESDEVGDNLGVNAQVAIRYTGNGSASTAALSRTALTTTVTGSSDGSAAFTYALTSTTTCSDLVAYVNAQTGYEAVLLGDGNFLAQDLDYFGAVSILTETGTVSMDTATRVDFSSGSITGLDDDDLVRISKSGQTDEFLFTVSGSAPEFIRGYNGTLPQVWASADAVTFVGLTSVNKEVLDFCNNTSQRVTAVRDTAYNTGLPVAPSTATFLTGATSPAVTNSDYETALSVVDNEFYRFGVLDSTDAAVHTFVKTHVENRWGKLALYGTWDLGASKDESEAVIKGRARTLNSADITLHFQDLNLPNGDGVDTNYSPWMLAALAASERATAPREIGATNTPVGAPLEGRQLQNVTALDQGFTLSNDAIERLLSAGVSVSHYDSTTGQYTFLRALTTWTSNDNLDQIASQVRSAVGWTLYKVNQSVKLNYIGKKAINSAATLEGIVSDALIDIRDNDEAIVVGYKNEGGQRVAIPAFSVKAVTVNGNVTGYTYEFTPVVGQDFAKGQPVVVSYTDTL